MNSLKKEYTRSIQNIWQAFYDHDEKRIDLIKNEIILRLNKYCEFHNQLIHQSQKFVDDENGYEKQEELTKRIIDDYNIPQKIWINDTESLIPKNRIRIYERYVKNNYCKGIPAKRGEYDLPHDMVPIHYMEELEDLDLLYIFFGVPLYAEYDWPKMFYYLKHDYGPVIYHIENRTNWQEGYFEEKWGNGNLCTAGHYLHGFPNGIWKLRSPDGTKNHFIEWSNGCLNGINYFYDSKTSELEGMEIANNGETLYCPDHYLDISRITGEKPWAWSMKKNIDMLIHPYKKTNKTKHGKFKEGDGDWYFEGEYNNNIPVGIWREYLDNKLIYELAYKDGEIDLENSIFRYKRTGTPIPWNKLK